MTTLAAGLFSPLNSVFVEDIGGGLVTAGSAYSLFAIASDLMIVLSSYWVDHFTHEAWLVAAGYALTGVDDGVFP